MSSDAFNVWMILSDIKCPIVCGVEFTFELHEAVKVLPSVSVELFTDNVMFNISVGLYVCKYLFFGKIGSLSVSKEYLFGGKSKRHRGPTQNRINIILRFWCVGVSCESIYSERGCVPL